jgi:tetratricopeptide (TPR) repeat protein
MAQLRTAIAALFVLLASVQVIRTAAVADQPLAALAVWPSHPVAVRARAMAEVGAAAARLREPGAETLDRLRHLARVEPLAAEPLLVWAAVAQRRGQWNRAEALLLQARDRDPRSAAARFLLADIYLRTGRVGLGLAELSVLARLLPGAANQIAPAMAAYAGSPGALPQLKRILQLYPELEPLLLERLAEDPNNAPLILSLGSSQGAAAGPPQWAVKLIYGMVEAGRFEQARALWAQLSGVSAQRGLFNPSFATVAAPPPFNWKLESGAAGVAEAGGGALRVLHFGRTTVVLASQLTLLPAGRYRLSLHLQGQVAEQSRMRWVVHCAQPRREIFRLPLTGNGAGARAGTFAVPAGCGAQWFELVGEAAELPQQSEFRISSLRLEEVG